MPKDVKSRVLRKLIDGAYMYIGDYSATGLQIWSTIVGGPTDGLPIGSEGWEVVTTGPLDLQFAVNRQYFDLQGYQNEELSFFPSNPQVQDMGDFQGATAFRVYDFMTVKPIDDNSLDLFFNNIGRPTPPGSSWNTMDLQDIIYAQWRLYEPSIDTLNTSKIAQSGNYGLGTATARDRIFLTRVVTISNEDAQVVFVPPCAWVLGGISAREKDLVHVERLRRSYDHSSP